MCRHPSTLAVVSLGRDSCASAMVVAPGHVLLMNLKATGLPAGVPSLLSPALHEPWIVESNEVHGPYPVPLYPAVIGLGEVSIGFSVPVSLPECSSPRLVAFALVGSMTIVSCALVAVSAVSVAVA